MQIVKNVEIDHTNETEKYAQCEQIKQHYIDSVIEDNSWMQMHTLFSYTKNSWKLTHSTQHLIAITMISTDMIRG